MRIKSNMTAQSVTSPLSSDRGKPGGRCTVSTNLACGICENNYLELVTHTSRPIKQVTDLNSNTDVARIGKRITTDTWQHNLQSPRRAADSTDDLNVLDSVQICRHNYGV